MQVSNLIGLFVLFSAAAATMCFWQSVMMAIDRKVAAVKAARAERKDDAKRVAELIERLDRERVDI